ncbi:MAG: hydratase [Clostridia bacterium]|nr:hydratase [Clostridia bacterium]
MIKLFDGGAFLLNGTELVEENSAKAAQLDKEEARKGTIAYGILKDHNTSGNMDKLKIKFDAMASHDITFVGIVQTAKASGMEKFPIPYVLTNCHNSLCAVGGTINEDDHVFGLSAARKYGGIYVPPHIAVIHQYMREMHAGCGKMIIGSDSHTRYGALGTMAVGEGGGELVKQLLEDTYDVAYPGVVGVFLEGKPAPGVGPQDIALAIIGAVFRNGYVKNKVMEFVGPGVASMSCDYRNGVDVMTTETTCLSSIWRTDENTKAFLTAHGRGADYRELNPADVTYYDGLIHIDLATIKPMIALPFHPSNAYEIEEFLKSPADILREIEKEAAVIQDNPDIDFSLTDKVGADGKVRVQQGIIAGCAGGTYSSICEAANILKNANCGNDEFTLSVYPSSQPVFMELVKNGSILNLMAAGAAVKTAFCGPCFGAGDTPANNALSIRHTTRNFPNREGSKPGNGQLSAVALMDARSIAATAANGGVLTPATEFADDYVVPEYTFDESSYASRVYQGFGRGQKDADLVYGPNIKDWPEMKALGDNILLKVCSKVMDPVTTTDELIPSGETSSFRSNPLGLAEFTLSRRDPEYVARAKAVNAGGEEMLKSALAQIEEITPGVKMEDVETGSMIYCVKPGDGSAREQAASCQRVLGGLANICSEYATKRYRSNVMNWGMVPFQMEGEPGFEVDDMIYVPGIRKAMEGDMKDIKAYVLGDKVREITLYIADMTDEEKEIVKAGCLINYNRKRGQK